MGYLVLVHIKFYRIIIYQNCGFASILGDAGKIIENLNNLEDFQKIL